MRMLDLFCGAGGAGVGYARAGFEVVGVDIDRHDDYPLDGYVADALGVLTDPTLPERFDAVHASPPCAAYTAIVKGTNGGRGDHPRLYEPVAEALEALGLPYVIENPAARPDIKLCGEMFGLGVLRHRNFEIGRWSCPQPEHKPHRGRVRGWRHGEYHEGPYLAVYGTGTDRRLSRGPGGGKASLEEARAAMGIRWTDDLRGITQAIPPAYTEYIGRALLEHLRKVAT